MSYHRVLPRPSTLPQHRDTIPWSRVSHAQSPDKVMTSDTSKPALQTTKKYSIPGPGNFPRAREQMSSSPSSESVNDFEETKSTECEPSAQISRQEPRDSGRRLPLTPWQQENSPTQICLCQPDPKIPRPRNGMLHTTFLHFLVFRNADRDVTLFQHAWLSGLH